MKNGKEGDYDKFDSGGNFIDDSRFSNFVYCETKKERGTLHWLSSWRELSLQLDNQATVVAVMPLISQKIFDCQKGFFA